MNDSKTNIKNDVFTIPNIMTFFRLLLIPVYAYLYMKAETMREYLIAGGVLLLSAITDVIDGIIARKCHMVTRLGILLDPVADKFTQGVIILCFTIRNPEILPLLLIFLVKETFMAVMGVLNLRKKKMLDGALIPGKICTVVLFSGMIALVIFPQFAGTWRTVIVTVCSCFMVISLIAYAICYFRRSPHIRDIS